jgi:hypothetical protein
MTAALLDRLTHRCHIFEMNDESYRFRESMKATPCEIIEAFGDRAAIEQDFHDVKEVWGAGQQQVRNI